MPSHEFGFDVGLKPDNRYKISGDQYFYGSDTCAVTFTELNLVS